MRIKSEDDNNVGLDWRTAFVFYETE